MKNEKITVKSSSMELIQGDVLILPTVADRLEDSAFNQFFYKKAGKAVRTKLGEQLPLKIGNVSVTSGGNLSVNRIVHVPVQTAPNVPTTEENLQIGLRSGLVTADEEGTTTVLLAKIVPPDQELDLSSVAQTLHQDISQYPPAHFDELKLLTDDSDWSKALGSVF